MREKYVSKSILSNISKKRYLLISMIAAVVGLIGCDNSENNTPPTTTTPEQPKGDALAYYEDWPVINSAIPKDEAIEIFIENILNQMTLEEKIGQMIQPDLRQVTPAEAKEFKLGSILNGGGSWPNNDKRATAEDWAKEADKYFIALDEAYSDRGFRVPFMWGTDAVHGHNNVFGATVFPHNIGLGATRDPNLIYRIGQATAQEVAATGLDWTFAPTVATPRDDRWGRTYEGYSEDPEIVYQYASEMVKGIQGNATDLKGDKHVISNVKHFVGDGGTFNGVDRGVNKYSEEQLLNIHATGYISGLNAGAQVVMASFNSWENDKNYGLEDSGENKQIENFNGKLHGSRYLLTDVLKNKMGFDGVVVSDWNGHTEIQNCNAGSCAAAVNAGVDIIMVTANNDWKLFYHNLLEQVKTGKVSEATINDAVKRILRIKARAGLWDKPMPSERALAGNQSILGSEEHRSIAREAVRKSLVLLKNDAQILPLSRDEKILLVGSGADNIMKQTGGWSLSWQGDGNSVDDFPNAQTFKTALIKTIGEANVITDSSLMEPGGTAIVVMGEDPYAEFYGDLKKTQTLEFKTIKQSYAADVNLIKDLKTSGFKVVTIFYSGRPLYVNDEINHSDAFVAAFLPGTEGLGMTDVLFKSASGEVNFPITGKLSFTWPNQKCATTINRELIIKEVGALPEFEQSINEENVLFEYGYGLAYGDDPIIDLNNLPLDPRAYGCGQNNPDASGQASEPLELFGKKSIKDQYFSLLAGDSTGWSAQQTSQGGPVDFAGIVTKPIDKDGQQDALNVRFTDAVSNGSQIYIQTPDTLGQDLQNYRNADSTLQFDIRVNQAPVDEITLSLHCVHPCLGEIKVSAAFLQDIQSATGDAVNKPWKTVKVPLSCFTGLDFTNVNTPFLIYSKQAMDFDLANIRWVPKSADTPSANDSLLSCQ